MTEQPGGPGAQAVECAESVRRGCVRGEGRVEMLAGGGVAGGTTLHWDARRAAELVQRAIDGALAEREAGVGRVVDAMDAMVASCCGDDRERFCEQYGCGTLRALADRLRAALAAADQEETR